MLGQHLISKLPDDLPMGGEKALPEAGQQMQPGKRICQIAGFLGRALPPGSRWLPGRPAGFVHGH
jgi:hypothetical protein